MEREKSNQQATLLILFTYYTYILRTSSKIARGGTKAFLPRDPVSKANRRRVIIRDLLCAGRGIRSR